MNGYPKEQATFARVSGYVEQFDVHSPQTTVREALLFSARLRTRGETNEVITAFVDEVMDLVELTPLRDGLVSGTCSVICVHVAHVPAESIICAPVFLTGQAPTAAHDKSAAGTQSSFDYRASRCFAFFCWNAAAQHMPRSSVCQCVTTCSQACLQKLIMDLQTHPAFQQCCTYHVCKA